MAEKRKRGQNFSLEDKDKLVKFLLQHKDTILNKKTDGATNEAKNSAWIAITNSYNSSSNAHRNKESLMKMWEKLKSDSKKYYCQMKTNTTKTGGGPLILKIDPVLEQVCSILGRGCTGILDVPDCDAEIGQEHAKVICTQDEFKQTTEETDIQIMEPQKLEIVREEMPDKSQPQNMIFIEDNLVEEPKADNIQDLQKPPSAHNKTPLWARRRPHISNNNERNEATSAVSSSIQNVYKKKETVEDIKEQLLREELEFKRKLYNLQLQAAAREVEIITAILEQIKGGGFSLNNLFGVPNEKKD